jgi:hypothetical protein
LNAVDSGYAAAGLTQTKRETAREETTEQHIRRAREHEEKGWVLFLTVLLDELEGGFIYTQGK